MNEAIITMNLREIEQRIKQYYWHEDLNCATVMLKILAEQHDIELSPQVIDSASGLHGAGKYGAQCGLVEGTLLFLGIYGRSEKRSDAEVIQRCNQFASQFEEHFSSLLCRELRPEGFSADLPPHLCEQLTCEAVEFSIRFVDPDNL